MQEPIEQYSFSNIFFLPLYKKILLNYGEFFQLWSALESSRELNIFTCVKLNIKGRVQGVFFRQSTCQEARSLNLSGWVRNNMDGSVEALVEGPDENVQKLIVWCHKGPPSARVDSVDVEDASHEAGINSQGKFVIIETAF